MLGRPPVMSASYMPEKLVSILAGASLTHVRVGRSGWAAGKQSSSFAVVNRLSLQLSGPRSGVSTLVDQRRHGS
jgi:hypothetical protein